MGIPHLPNFPPVKAHPFYQVFHLAAIESLISGDAQVSEPNLGRPLGAVDMDMPGFIAFKAPEVEPAASPAEDGWHGS
jgi:hypothetical protein